MIVIVGKAGCNCRHKNQRGGIYAAEEMPGNAYGRRKESAPWTPRLLEDAWAALEPAETVSRETIRRTLKNLALSPGKTGNGVFGLYPVW
jgi:hypothetical protein